MADPTHCLLVSLGANVRRWRKRRGLTQEALAEKADLDVRYVQRVERGSVNLRFRSFAILATVLAVKPGLLLRESPPAPAVPGRPRKRKAK